MLGVTDQSEFAFVLRRLEYDRERPNTPFDRYKLSNAELTSLRMLRERLARKYGEGTIEREIRELAKNRVEIHEMINALTLSAPSDELPRIKSLVAKMDFASPQLLIEAVIIEFPIGDPNMKHHVEVQRRPGLTALNDLGLAVNTTFPFQQTNAFADVNDSCSYLSTLRGDMDATVDMLATNGAAKILQRPRIQTSEGEPALLFVGPSRPYSKNAYYSGGAYSCGCYSSIQSVNIGTTFEVTCWLPANGLIRMEINRSTETPNGSVNIAHVGEVPITKRDDSRAQTFVRDGEMIAIGGILETNKVSIFSEVDLLDRVPGGGYVNKLLTYPKRTTRSELVILMRAIELPTPELAAVGSKDAMPRPRPPEPELPRNLRPQ
jgi:type II secretory pathway component GspD/PulD (secretin)